MGQIATEGTGCGAQLNRRRPLIEPAIWGPAPG